MKVNVTAIHKITKRYTCRICGNKVIVHYIERTPLRRKRMIAKTVIGSQG